MLSCFDLVSARINDRDIVPSTSKQRQIFNNIMTNMKDYDSDHVQDIFGDNGDLGHYISTFNSIPNAMNTLGVQNTSLTIATNDFSLQGGIINHQLARKKELSS